MGICHQGILKNRLDGKLEKYLFLIILLIRLVMVNNQVIQTFCNDFQFCILGDPGNLDNPFSIKFDTDDFDQVDSENI